MRCSVSGRWLGLGGLAVLTACSASGSGSLGNGSGIADGAVSSRDARASDGATGADSGRPGTDGGRSDGGGTTKPDDAGSIPTFDASVGPRDGGTTTPGTDGGTTTPGADGGVAQCGTRERCGNGLDDNCNDQVDESCPCIPGTSQRCYPGDPARAGRGVCNYGMQTCTGTGEFGTYGACEGFGLPRPVTCGMGLDFRCTGIVDEGCECATGATRSCYTGRMGTAGVGLCRAGRQTCVATSSGGSTWGMCEGEVIPSADRCDGMDRDCDGNPNTGCTCTRGATRSCYTGPAGTSTVGLCRAGTQACVASPTGNGTTWSTCQGQVLPSPDLCDGMDRNCDGNPNTGCTCTRGATRPCYTGPAGTQGVGICRPGTQTCIASSSGTGTVWSVCTGEQRPNPTEICTTSVDDNCNGMVNEGCTTTPPCPNNQPLCGGRCCTDNQACVDGVCVGSGQLRITLTWDRRGDLDLHVVPPYSPTALSPCLVGGSEIYYARSFRSACGGTLDVDNCAGNPVEQPDSSCNGPENVFWTTTPPTGTYLVCVNPWAIDPERTLNFTVSVYRGSQLLRTWTGSRAGSVGYQRCARNTPAFVGDFTI